MPCYKSSNHINLYYYVVPNQTDQDGTYINLLTRQYCLHMLDAQFVKIYCVIIAYLSASKVIVNTAA